VKRLAPDLTDGGRPESRSLLFGWLPGPPAYVLNRSGIPLFPLPVAYAVAKPWGDFAYAVWRNKAETARRNFAVVLGTSPQDPRVDRMARRCFRQFALYVAEMIDVQGWDTETVLDRLEVEGEECFAEAESHGKGTIFVSAHMGSAEIAASIVVLRGYRITSVLEGRYPPYILDWIRACRKRMGITLLPANRSGMSLVRRLRRGEMVALVVDAGVTGGDGIAVEFFGRETVFPAGPARLARLGGAPIVFGLAVRTPRGRFKAFVEPPIVSDRTLGGDEDARGITQQIASTFERYVRRYPDQWYAFRDMWPGLASAASG
jgi:Kdo2-lipid IVA lauroyltransferase/acyltransferase